jgi:1,4-alpha-glucan branching enzyme
MATRTVESLPYMYRLVNAEGRTVYRTDIFSRSQIGTGAINPARTPWPGTVDTLDGTVSDIRRCAPS